MFRQRLLFGRELVFRYCQRFTILRFQSAAFLFNDAICKRFFDFCQLVFDRLQSRVVRFQRLLIRLDFSGRIVREIRIVSGRKERLKPIEIRLQDRIELVIVAAGATDGQAEKR